MAAHCSFLSFSMRSLAAVALLTTLGCSRPQDTLPRPSSANWIKDGMIAISRPVPGVSESASPTLLGFMPVQSTTHVGAWLSIDRADSTVSLMNGSQEVNALTAQGLEGLKPGKYQILHKQRSALWYAPDTYFSSRDEAVPAQGDRSRYRRGALGEFVLYLDKDTPIHSGPIWTDEIGGVRLSDSDISRIYYSVDIGAVVEVR